MPEDSSLPLEPQMTPRTKTQSSFGGGSAASANNGGIANGMGASSRTGAKGGSSGSGVVSTSVSRRSVADRKAAALGSVGNGSTVVEKKAPMPACIDGANVEDGNPLTPAEGELSVCRLRRNRTAG